MKEDYTNQSWKQPFTVNITSFRYQWKIHIKSNLFKNFNLFNLVAKNLVKIYIQFFFESPQIGKIPSICHVVMPFQIEFVLP